MSLICTKIIKHVKRESRMTIKYLIVPLIGLALAGCGSESDGSKTHQPTVSEVNQLLSESIHHEGLQLSCDGDLSGCFITSCKRSSDYYSSRLVYSLENEKLKVVNVTYQNSSCEVKPDLHPTSWSNWDISLSNLNVDTGQADLEATLVYYSDGYILASPSTKPVKDTVYKSKIWVDAGGEKSRLCLSEGLIDPSRPVKFMETEDALPLDTNNCVDELI